MIVLLLGLWVVGCTSANRNPIIVSEQAPTITPTPITIAVEATPTSSPSPEATSTPAPTIDLSNTSPIAPGVSPTSILGATHTPAPPTQTRTPAPTELGIDIEYFITNAEIVAPGDNVTLYWQVFGAEEITIYSINTEGERENPRPGRAEDSITLSTPPDVTETAVFVLVAEAGGIEIEERLEITINCEGEWFFAPSPGGCPAEASEPATFVQAGFENGLMIWSSQTQEIFIFYENNGERTWEVYADEFQESNPESNPELIPPAPNLQQPVRGFGLVWRTKPGVRERLGWATTGESSFSGIQQSGVNADGETVIYMRRLDNNVLALLPEGAEWQLIVPENTPESQ